MKELAAGNHPFANELNSAKNPIVIVGSESLQREDGGAIMSLVQQIADNAKESQSIDEIVNYSHQDSCFQSMPVFVYFVT